MDTRGIKHGEWECKNCHEKRYDIFDQIDLCQECYYSGKNKEMTMVDLYELRFFRTAAKGSNNCREAQQLFAEIIKCGASPHKLISFLSALYGRVKSDDDFVNEFRKLRAIFPELNDDSDEESDRGPIDV